MTDSCSTCFFFKTFNVIKRGSTSPVGVCARNAPLSGSNIAQDATLWPEIKDPANWWCGDFLTSYPASSPILTWQSYVPTVGPSSGAWTGSPTISYARFTQLGKLVLFTTKVVQSTESTGSGSVVISLPVAPETGTYAVCSALLFGVKGLAAYIFNGLQQINIVNVADNSYPGSTGAIFYASGAYPAA